MAPPPKPRPPTAPPTEPELSKWTAAVAAITRRPARRQIDPGALELTQKVYEGTYNIWYNKWTGQKHKGRFEIGERAPTRVNVQRDSGFTLADKRRARIPSMRSVPFCLLFARGCCSVGHKCEYLHRVPLPPADPEETTRDCFGRLRHLDEREDMNGVGCFNRENRSLYIGNLHPSETGDNETALRKHFSPFGAIEQINVIGARAIAFVRFVRRSSAEFAKEAMEHQALDASEILSVRWAYDDPNPRVVVEERKRLECEFVDHYVAKKARTNETPYMDEETRSLVVANPNYNSFYSYYHVADEELASLPPPENLPTKVDEIKTKTKTKAEPTAITSTETGKEMSLLISTAYNSDDDDGEQ